MRRPVLLAVLALLLAVRPAAARDGDRSGITLLDRFGEGVPWRVTISGPIAYVALDSGLAIYDLAIPSAPVRIGHLYLPSAALDVAVEGSYAFVAAGESGLLVVDVADPARPLLAGALPTSGTRAVAVRGGVAYLAEASEPVAGVYGLRTVDVSIPTAPRALAFQSTRNGALDVELSGTIAWLGVGADFANPNRGLEAIDVADPANPATVPGGYLDTGFAVNQVALSGGLAYLATGLLSTGALVIADLSAPSSPALLSRTFLADGATGVSWRASTAYLATGSAGLISYDVSNSASPRLLGALRSARQTVAVDTIDGFALIGERAQNGDSALSSVDIGMPANMLPLAVLSSAVATDVALSRGLLFLLWRDALSVLGAGIPPVPVATWRPGGGDFSTLAVRDLDLVAVGEADDLRLLDITDPYAPVERGRLSVADGTAVRAAFDGNRLHVVTGRGVESFDVTDPAAPSSLGSFPTTGASAALAIDGTIAYLVAGDTFHVLDLGAGMAPTALGSLVLPGASLYGVDGRSGRAVATGIGGALWSLDVSDPASPRLDGQLAGGPGFAVRLEDTRALLAMAEQGLWVVDLADPANPVLEASYDTSGTAASLANELGEIYLVTGPSQHWMVRCDTCPVSCVDRWATVTPNSLRAARIPGGQAFWWQVTVGDHEFNLHRTGNKAALPNLWNDPASLVTSGSGLSVGDAFDPPPGGVAAYRVFARGTCTGLSHFP